jgi:hypothetical protein
MSAALPHLVELSVEDTICYKLPLLGDVGRHDETSCGAPKPVPQRLKPNRVHGPNGHCLRACVCAMRPLAAAAAVVLCSASVVQDAAAFGPSSGWRRSATGGMLRPRTSASLAQSSSDDAAAAPQQIEARSLALPPRFVEKINVPLDTPFQLEREGKPTAAELEDTNLIKVRLMHSDRIRSTLQHIVHNKL